MNRSFVRVFALLLATLMLLVPAVACAEPDTPDTPSTPNTPNNPNTPDTPGEPDVYDPYQVEDNLPEVTFDGASFDILYYVEAHMKNFYTEQKTGDLIDDAVWSAIATTEERFDVDIGVMQSGAEGELAYTATISTQIGAGATDFDIANVHDVQGGNLSIQGYFLNALEFSQFDFSKPWWAEKAVETLSYMGQMYLISSTMSYNSLGSQVVFFNKQMMDDYGLEYPYELVLDKAWYLDDMFTMAEDTYSDVNANDEKDAEDQFGVLIPREFYCIWESYGINMIEKDDDGYELILNAHDERILDVVDAYYYIIHECDEGYIDVRNNTVEMFKNNQGLFLMTSLNNAATSFRDISFAYGIVPYPMLDELQGEYYSGYTDRFMVIPNTCTDRDFVGTIIESMSAEGYRQIIPAYYEIALKGRYTHDSESVQMLEIIREARVIDFAYVYSNDTACTRALYTLMNNKSKDYASFYAGKVDSANTRIDELVAYFEKMS